MQETKPLQHWIALANSREAEDREVAARALGAFIHDHSGTTALIELLGDPDWRVRRATVETFLQARQPHTIPMVVDALYEEENAGKRNAALDILSRFGKGIIPYLEPHISAEQSDVRMFLIQILGDLRDTTYLAFINQALGNENQNVVSAAILALGKIGRPDSISPLLRFLEGPDLWLKTQAIEGLSEIQEPKTIRNLIGLHSIPYCRRAVLKALGKFHDPLSYGALIEFLVHDGKPDPGALDALVQLNHSPQPARLKNEEQKTIRELCRKELKSHKIDILLEFYPECSGPEKKNILEVLGWAAAKPAISLFLSELQNESLLQVAAKGLIDCDETALNAVIQRLKQSGSEKEIVTLLSILRELSSVVDIKHIENFLKHGSSEIRQAAHKLLARIPATDALPFWIQSISDSDPFVSESCREPLLSLCKRDGKARAEIQSALRQKIPSASPAERANAFEFLILLEGNESLPLLFQAIKDPDAFVRRKAVQLMGSGYHRDFPKYLIAALADEDPQVRELSAKTLARYKSAEVAEALISLLEDDVIWVRIAAYESLSAQAQDDLLPVFLKHLTKEEPMAQSSLLKCIGRFRGNASKELLLQYLQSDDPEIRKGACEGLAGWKDRDVVFRLFTLFESDPDWRVRVAAVRILADLKPLGLQDALLHSLKADKDRLVRQEILTALRKLPLHSPPEEVYDLLSHEELMEDAYEFLHACREQFGAILRQHADSQPPHVRRLIKAAAR